MAKPYSPSTLLEAVAELTASDIEGQPAALEMPFATDAMPSAQSIPMPVQEPDK